MSPHPRPEVALDPDDPWLSLPADEREAAIRDGFGRVGSARDGGERERALGALAHLIALQSVAHARSVAEAAARGSDLLGSLIQRRFIRTFEVLDAFRRMGRFSDLDELYRVFAIDDRLARFVHGSIDARGWTEELSTRVQRFHDHHLFEVAAGTPPGELLPPPTAEPDGGPTIEPEPIVVDAAVLATAIDRITAEDRIAAATEGWRQQLADRSPEEIEELERVMDLDRKEHQRYLRLARWAAGRRLLTDDELSTVERAFGRYDKSHGGWPAGTELAAKVAVTQAVASLHDLFGALSD